LPTLRREAAEIWSLRRARRQTLPCASAPDEAIVLTVRTGRPQTARPIDQPAALGAIN
jgi:hypothetical protein